MTNIGPFIYNSTIVCLNDPRLMSYNKANFSPSISPLGEIVALNLVTRISRYNKRYISFLAPNHDDLIQCPQDTDDDMGTTVESFWNISFAFMIITAILGNTAVLYTVISMKKITFILKIIKSLSSDGCPRCPMYRCKTILLLQLRRKIPKN